MSVYICVDLLTQTNTAITVICGATAARLWDRPQRPVCTAGVNPAVSITATQNYSHQHSAVIWHHFPRRPSSMPLPAVAARELKLFLRTVERKQRSCTHLQAIAWQLVAKPGGQVIEDRRVVGKWVLKKRRKFYGVRDLYQKRQRCPDTLLHGDAHSNDVGLHRQRVEDGQELDGEDGVDLCGRQHQHGQGEQHVGVTSRHKRPTFWKGIARELVQINPNPEWSNSNEA